MSLTADHSAMTLLEVIKEAIAVQPRNTQRLIGPSEIGVPCARRLGYKWAGVPEVNEQGVAWKPYVGTAMHAQLAEVFGSSEELRGRFRVEQPVKVGTVDGVEIAGTCDLFDVAAGAVWDWKFTTKNKIARDYKPNGPGDQYRVQAHLYGQGYVNAGFEVRSVGVVFFTRDGDFSDRYIWHEPFDPDLASGALERMSAVADGISVLGVKALELLPTEKAYCNFCPWFRKGSTDFAVACSGHGEAQKEKTLAEMIGA